MLAKFGMVQLAFLGTVKYGHQIKEYSFTTIVSIQQFGLSQVQEV